MKIRRNALLSVFFLVTVALAIFAGCSMSAEEKAESIVVAYLEERYGETFYPTGVYDESTSTVEMYVICDSLPDAKIHVYAENWQEPDRVITDNYLMYKKWDEIEAYIQEQVFSEFPTANIYAAVVDRTLSSALPADASMEQVLADSNAKLYVQVEIPANEFTDKQQAKRVIERIQEDVTDYDFLFISVPDEVYGTMDGNELIHCYDLGDVVVGAIFYRIHGNTKEDWKYGEAAANFN